MGVSALTLGAIMGASTLASGLLSGISESGQLQAQAQAQEAQAQALRANARIQKEQGEIAAQAQDKQRAQLRREYESKQGRNLNLLAAGNVDLSSGSALAVHDGNADAYALDFGENLYQRNINIWENNNRVKSTLHQASLLESSAASQKKRAGNVFPSLLSSTLAAGNSFLSGYALAGGKIGK